VLDWLKARSDSLFLSVVTIAEIESGIANAARKEALRKAASLTAWLEAILHRYGRPGCFPWIRQLHAPPAVWTTSREAPACARLRGHRDRGNSATQGLISLTRNLRHFQPLGLSVLDPLGGSLP
jgi:toxin FitB